MPGITNFTDDQKKGFLVVAQKEGRTAAAKKAKVTPQTIKLWADKFGVELNVPHPDAPKKKRRAKKVASKANGKANGHASAAPASGQFDSVERQLTAALESVRVMRNAFRQAFGG